ncbi:MAG: type II secretion system F family protein [Actinomycetota bacterium]|nr:type II secretion system F family protein [Actinomycetota bacterium]MDA3000295.1 type II secretion system F family protein [Actinomycetota bacterium]
MTSRRRAGRRVRRLARSDGGIDCLFVAETIGRRLRAGSTLLEAIRHTSRVEPRGWLGTVMTDVRNGESLASALESRLDHESSRRRPDGDRVLTLRVLSLAARIGGEPSRHIESLSNTLRSRRTARADRISQASTALASIRLLTWLPIVCALWMIGDDPEVRHLLVATPIGWTCISLGVGFNLIGRRWTSRLVTRQ